MELLEGFFQVGTWCADVEAHVSAASGAECFSVVEGEAGAVHEEVDEVLVGEVEVAAVEPYEEGCLWWYDVDAGDVSGDVLGGVLGVLFEVFDEFLSPLPSFGVGGFGGYGCEEVGGVQFVCF